MASSTLSSREEKLLDIMIEAARDRKRRQRREHSRRRREGEDVPLDEG